MIEVGAFKAKTHLAEFLERVARGERILITRRGKAVAMLVPPETHRERDVAAVVADMLALRDQYGPTLGQENSLRQFIQEGRRF